MSEKPKDDTQTFSEFLSLSKKIEEIVDKTPDRKAESEGEDKPEVIQEEKVDRIETETIQSESELEIDQVEQEATDLDTHIDVVQKESSEKSKMKRREDIIEIEEALLELFTETSISVNDFYYSCKEIGEEDIIKRIKGRLHSLESIKITEQETLSYPFALCKLENSFNAVIPIDLEGILLPTFLSGDKKQLKMLAVGKKEFQELEVKERENLIQAINKIQMSLVKLLNRGSKDRLSKEEFKKAKLVELDHSVIYEFITDYKNKMGTINNYQIELIKYLLELKDSIENNKQIWKNDDYEKVIDEVRPQLKEKQKEYTTKGRDAQVSFIKLKQIQKQIDARTKRLQIDEKRGKKATREQKEELINELRKFQTKKKRIQETIKDTKKQEDVLEKWIDIFSLEGSSELNEKLLYYFSESIINIIKIAIDTQEIETILKEKARIKSILETIIAHIIYVPVNIYTFSAKQANQVIEGRLIYFEPTGEITFLKPSIN
ncbi:MAG: hypothetical protein KGD64_09015 [Candidatus Heimdallarchaeota archaeon]|nr:hypothetical protein [Candidatus Heimdallarchaeota archaeon]